MSKALNDECRDNALRAHIGIGGHFMGRPVGGWGRLVEFVF